MFPLILAELANKDPLESTEKLYAGVVPVGPILIDPPRNSDPETTTLDIVASDSIEPLKMHFHLNQF